MVNVTAGTEAGSADPVTPDGAPCGLKTWSGCASHVLGSLSQWRARMATGVGRCRGGQRQRPFTEADSSCSLIARKPHAGTARIPLTGAGCLLPGCRPWCARSVAAGCRVRSGFAVPLEDPRRRTAVLWPLCSGPSNRVGTREKKKPGAGIWCGRQAATSETSNPRGARRAAGTTNHCQWRCPKRPHLRAATTASARRVPWLPSTEGNPGRR